MGAFVTWISLSLKNRDFMFLRSGFRIFLIWHTVIIVLCENIYGALQTKFFYSSLRLPQVTKVSYVVERGHFAWKVMKFWPYMGI